MANYITTRGDNIALTSNFCINSIMGGGSGREGGKNLQLTWLLFFPYLRINFFLVHTTTTCIPNTLTSWCKVLSALNPHP